MTPVPRDTTPLPEPTHFTFDHLNPENHMKQCLHGYSKQASAPVQHFKNTLLMTAWVEQQSESWIWCLCSSSVSEVIVLVGWGWCGCNSTCSMSWLRVSVCTASIFDTSCQSQKREGWDATCSSCNTGQYWLIICRKVKASRRYLVQTTFPPAGTNVIKSYVHLLFIEAGWVSSVCLDFWLSSLVSEWRKRFPSSARLFFHFSSLYWLFAVSHQQHIFCSLPLNINAKQWTLDADAWF